MFLNSLKDYQKAIFTVNRLLRLKPNANDLYLSGGIYYMKSGDSISAKAYLNKSLQICSQALDTMKADNKEYLSLALNRAINIILLGDQEKGNKLLEQLRDRETNSERKAYIDLFRGKNQPELMELSDGTYSR